MIASEVPTQSCMRTSSGTPSDAEDFVEHRHDDRAAADAEQTGEQAGDDAADDDRGREHGELAERDAEHRILRRDAARTGGSQAAAVCANSAGLSRTMASASASTATPAPGFTACVARCRRNARAPGTAWNRPCRCRVMECSRAPRASSRSM